MKYLFSEMQSYYAAKRGFSSFSTMDSLLQASAKIQINTLLDLIWNYKGGWGFNGDKLALTWQASITGTVSGTAGQRVVTFGSALNASTNGVSLIGQTLVINNRPYRLISRRSSTVYTLGAPLSESYTSAAFTIFFSHYPLPHRIGGVKYVEVPYSEDPLPYWPEYMSAIGVVGGQPESAFNAGRTTQDFYNTGTLAFTLNSNLATISAGTESLEHIGMSLQVKTSGGSYQWFTIIDVDTTGHTFTLDRNWLGANASSVSFAINPAGLQMIGFKPFPQTAERVNVAYTFQCEKLVNDNDLTQLPDDNPMMVGIEVLGTKWETIGSMSNMNEVIFNDKKFKESLKVLNFRGTPLQNRMFSLQDTRMRYFPRNTNPWNSPGWGGR